MHWLQEHVNPLNISHKPKESSKAEAAPNIQTPRVTFLLLHLSLKKCLSLYRWISGFA